MRKPFNEIVTKYGFFSIQSLNLYLIYRIVLDPRTQSRLTLYFIQIRDTVSATQKNKESSDFGFWGREQYGIFIPVGSKFKTFEGYFHQVGVG